MAVCRHWRKLVTMEVRAYGENVKKEKQKNGKRKKKNEKKKIKKKKK